MLAALAKSGQRNPPVAICLNEACQGSFQIAAVRTNYVPMELGCCCLPEARITLIRASRAFMSQQERRLTAARYQIGPPARLENALYGVDAISTAALLDLLREPVTTATARRVAAVMRSLHFIPIKSRRLMPGGRAGNTVTRGWACPFRTMRSSPTTSNAGRAGLNRQGMIL